MITSKISTRHRREIEKRQRTKYNFYFDDIFRGTPPSKASVYVCSFAAVSCPSSFYMQNPFFRNLDIYSYSKKILAPLLLCPTISKTYGVKLALTLLLFP